MTLLSGVRAYVGGEGLWSKAQKDGIYHLRRYADTRDEQDFARYLQQFAVPLGDRQARLELEKSDTDYELVYRSFMAGRNHRDDVQILAQMFKRLRWVGYIDRAIGLWRQGDEHIAQFERVAGELHTVIVSGNGSREEINRLVKQIEAINADLTPIEDAFSYTLGEAARWLKNLLVQIMLLGIAAFLGAGLSVAVIVGRRLTREIHTLRDQAMRIAAGDFNLTIQIESKDEIGDLAKTFQQMATQRWEAEAALVARARELDEINQKLVQAERIKDEFFANVSHELRTPLTLILAPLESLLAGEAGRMTSVQRKSLETMHNNSVRLYQMVTGILDFSKLEAGKMPVNREPTDVVALSRSIFEDFQPLMKRKNLASVIEVEPSTQAPQAVQIDPYLYERILFNLLSNAVKFTLEGGRVSVRLTLAADRLRLDVKDSGIGIAPSDMATLFQKFRQLEAASTRRFEGTGLGLALVREFAERLGGEVSVVSKVGEGSCFTVECTAPQTELLGAVLGAPREHTVQKYWRAGHVGSEPTAAERSDLPKVLIAEDNVELGAYIAGVIDKICCTRVAQDGEEALSIVRAWVPDLVLTDVMMPKRDGLSLCREIKANQDTVTIPVILLTALTYREALLKGWEVGADDYLYKPFHPQELLTRIRTLLGMIEERKQARLYREAQEAVKLRDEFLSIASHELRTPLTALQLQLESLDRGTKRVQGGDPDGQQSAKRELGAEKIATKIALALRQTTRLSKLIDSLLDISRITSGRLELQLEEFNLVDLVHEVVERFTEEAADTAGPIALHSNRPVVGRWDRLRCEQILMNLLSNAIKYSSGKPIEVTIGSEGGRAKLVVRDQGIGIDPKDMVRIFDRFERAVSSRHYGGLGLGLYITRQIVEAHGGSIEVASRLGESSTFTVWMPMPTTDSPPKAK